MALGKNLAFVGGVFACLLGMTAPSQAVVLKASYTGTITADSFDLTNLFGFGNNSSLGGRSVVLDFLYDVDLPGVGFSSNPPNFILAYGGPGYGTVTNPMLSANVTVNGRTNAISGTYAGSLYQDFESSSGRSFASYGIQDSTFTGLGDHSNYAVTVVQSELQQVPLDFRKPYTWNDPNLYTALGYFQFAQSIDFLGNYSTYTYGNIVFDSLTVSRVSAVPLPGSLPLLITGLGALIMRSKRKSCR